MVRASNVARVVVLLLVAAGGAALSNVAASAQRKLAWVGSYPRALDVAPAGSEGRFKGPTTAASAPAANPASPAPTESGPAASVAGGSMGIPASTPGAGATAAVGDSEADLTRSFPPHPDKPAVDIAPEDAQRLYRRKALFLDARRSSVYAEGHITGARSFPVWEADIGNRVKELYEESLDQKQPVVIYCSGGNCEDSHMLAEKLYMVGFDNVLIYREGFPDWQKRGLPVSKGAKP
jgi:rhodanese-related sulfurtransferase